MIEARRPLIAALLVALWPGVVPAAICDVTYRSQPGDTLQSVAERHYGDARHWRWIEMADPGTMTGPEVPPGTDLFLPCRGDAAAGIAEPAPGSAAVRMALPDGPESTESDANGPDPKGSGPDGFDPGMAGTAPVPRADLVLLTAGDYMPFADRAWTRQGLAVELVTAALELAPSPVSFEIAWEDDRSRHMFPLLDEKRHDMGFPWVAPDCAAQPELRECAGFHYSAPLMDLPVMLFKRADAALSWDGQGDLAGARLCRPKGFFTHDLDRADRRWLSEGTVSLMRPATAETCFEALMAGEVDAVTVDVFLGAAKIVSMGLRGRVVPIDTPLSRETLHVVISKTHPRGTAHLYRVNAGLEALRASGRHTEIVARHLEIFWDRLK